VSTRILKCAVNKIEEGIVIHGPLVRVWHKRKKCSSSYFLNYFLRQFDLNEINN
jgi:hypothetical protein